MTYDEVMTESYMTMAQSENCHLVDASIQKNISFDGKPVTPTSWNGGIGEILSLRDQLKQAEEKASKVQREVRGFRNRAIPRSHGIYKFSIKTIFSESKQIGFDVFVVQCDSLKMELKELQILYDSSQRERVELEEELQRCKAELEKLSMGAQVRNNRALFGPMLSQCIIFRMQL